MIEFKNITKSYGSTQVLERINATVEPGEFITMVGASGCGKSTFLNMLLGTEQPTTGRILLDGKPLPQEPGPDRGIVFQQYSVFPHLTVLANVMAAKGLQRNGVTGLLWGAARSEALAESMAMLEQVGLVHSLKKYPHELSGGMRQRLAIAQALLAKPRILLLDEPFGALDPGIRTDMHHLVLNLWQQNPVTLFMVTHDLREGFFLGTRLWVFDKIRHDAQAPNAFGATITYDLPVGKNDQQTWQKINKEVHNTAKVLAQ